jgi:capsule polysaccharide modification protein KpsS
MRARQSRATASAVRLPSLIRMAISVAVKAFVGVSAVIHRLPIKRIPSPAMRERG